MGNLLTNASFLDGTADWAAPSALALSAQEDGYGAPGRIVLQAFGATSAGTVYEVYQDAPLTNAAGQAIELSVLTVNATAVSLEFVSAAPAIIGVAPAKKTRLATVGPKRGVPTGFDRWYTSAVAPAGTAYVRIAIDAKANSSQTTLLILKPYLGVMTGLPYPATWDPGLHLNPDIQLDPWPTSLRPVQNSTNPTPVPNAKSFSTDSNIPIREDTYSGLHYEFKGLIRVTQDEQETLGTFYDTHRGQFWFLDPFTDRLCVAEWLADGAPTFQEDQGVTAIYQFGLHLTVV